MKLKQATEIAEQARETLSPYCDRIEIAGSIRRRKPEVKDIEIVCIPKRHQSGLFAEDTEVEPFFARAVDRWPGTKGTPHGKYTQRILPGGIMLDLFMATPENWGLIYAMRTGSAAFSHRVLAVGWVRAGYKSEDGMLRKNGEAVPVREEDDLFELIGVAWVAPEGR